MKILLLGSGGREHAFAWKMAQSPLCKGLFIAPGNSGTASLGENVNLSPNDFDGIKAFVLQNAITMVVVGPEEPLVLGIYDYFKKDNQLKSVSVIGPSAQSAQLEGSKAFAKAFMAEFNIPTASYKEFTQATLSDGLAHIDQEQPPIVLKADGLAAGKGVVILENREAAKNELKDMLSGKFGDASSKVVIESFLKGIEFSVFVLSDGSNYVILPEAKDYKRIGEGDKGLNTGGMGAVSPVPFVDDALMKKVEEQVVIPTMNGLKSRNMDYKGFIFLGLILVGGEPYVIEYNCRMGDPETEVVLPRIQNDLCELFDAVANGTLDQHKIVSDERAATTVMLVSGGYPEAYEKGKVISGIDDIKESIVFHAGVKMADGQFLTNGGRVMALTSFGSDVQTALNISNKNAEQIQFEGKNYRKDIGLDLL